jgi:hypothetical protein
MLNITHYLSSSYGHAIIYYMNKMILRRLQDSFSIEQLLEAAGLNLDSVSLYMSVLCAFVGVCFSRWTPK